MSDGPPASGQRCRRAFEDTDALATITKWLPADDANGEPALFRCVHDDGDEEDLEEDEAAEAVKAFDRLAKRHSAQA